MIYDPEEGWVGENAGGVAPRWNVLWALFGTGVALSSSRPLSEPRGSGRLLRSRAIAYSAGKRYVLREEVQ